MCYRCKSLLIYIYTSPRANILLRVCHLRFTSIYIAMSMCYFRIKEHRDRRDTFDGEKEVRRRQAPLASNYRTGFS